MQLSFSSDSCASIIIPLFNGVDFTRRCLDSLARYTDPALYELILVDNASNDATTELLAALPSAVTVIRNSTNLGFAQACNQGAEAAKGQYLLFLNNDTVVTPGWLKALTETTWLPDVGITGCRLLYPDGRIQHAGIELINGAPDHPWRYSDANAPEVTIRKELDMVTGACLMIRRNLFTALGGFDEIYQNGVEDVDLCLRVREAGFKVVYEPGSVVYHHEGQSSGRFDKVRENLELFFRRWKGRFSVEDKFISAETPYLMRSVKSLLIPAVPLKIVWQGAQLVCHSLALVNREICLQLVSKGHDLQLLRSEPDQLSADSDARFKLLAACSNVPHRVPDVVVHHHWPPSFDPPPDSPRWIMIQPWEFGSLPKAWISPMNNLLDEIWVPSSYVKDCYRRSGVKPEKVYVVPNGVDTEMFCPSASPREIPTTASFRFLFVGGTIARKGIDILLAAYAAEFSDNDDVCLVVKDMGGGSFYKGQTADDVISRFCSQPGLPQLLHLGEALNEQEMAGLYTACNCLVHPYRGEGFGLPMAEAMACALPVIVTGHGAALDFCNDANSYLIPTQEVRLPNRAIGEIETVDFPWLAEPDIDGLRRLMRHVFENHEESRVKGKLGRSTIVDRFTWKHVGKIVEERLKNLVAKERLYHTSTPNAGDVEYNEEAFLRSRILDETIKEAFQLTMRDEVDKAVTLLIQRGIRVAPDDQASYLNLMEILMAAGRHEEALQVLPEMPPVTDLSLKHEVEAICLCALGNDYAAEQAARLVFSNEGKHPRTLVVLGTLAARRGNIPEAEVLFRQAIESDPSCAGAWLSLGMLLWGNGDREGAWQAVKRSVILDPLNSDAVDIMRDMVERLG